MCQCVLEMSPVDTYGRNTGLSEQSLKQALKPTTDEARLSPQHRGHVLRSATLPRNT